MSKSRFSAEKMITKASAFTHYTAVLKDAKPSDLIEFDRGLYRHWAMYAGNGMVINMCAEDQDEKRDAWVRLQSLEYVCKRDPNPRHQLARINNKPDIPGQLLRPTSRTEEKALEAAREMLDTVEPYEINGRNSEYYCNLWKFGRIFSDQVMEAVRKGLL